MSQGQIQIGFNSGEIRKSNSNTIEWSTQSTLIQGGTKQQIKCKVFKAGQRNHDASQFKYAKEHWGINPVSTRFGVNTSMVYNPVSTRFRVNARQWPETVQVKLHPITTVQNKTRPYNMKQRQQDYMQAKSLHGAADIK